MENLTLIIPAKNEKNSLPRVLKEIEDYKLNKLIVMSKEDIETYEAIKNLDCEILFQSGKGYGNAIIEGINKTNTEFISIFYADGSTDPKYLNPMLNKIINENNDIVFGSRYEKNAGSYDDNIITSAGNFFFTIIGKLFFSLKISDILFTYIVAKKSVFKKIELKCHDYRLCVEIPIKVKKFNLPHTTYPCVERKRFADKKKVKALTDGFAILFYMIKTFFSKSIN